MSYIEDNNNFLTRFPKVSSQRLRARYGYIDPSIIALKKNAPALSRYFQPAEVTMIENRISDSDQINENLRVYWAHKYTMTQISTEKNRLIFTNQRGFGDYFSLTWKLSGALIHKLKSHDIMAVVCENIFAEYEDSPIEPDVFGRFVSDTKGVEQTIERNAQFSSNWLQARFDKILDKLALENSEQFYIHLILHMKNANRIVIQQPGVMIFDRNITL